MHRTPSGPLQFSPSDLIAWLEGEFASWCDRLRAEGQSSTAESPEINPDSADEELELLARKGSEHEQRFLADLRARHPEMVELVQGKRDTAATLTAMQAGAPVIYQPYLSLPPFAGYPDFLFRVAGASRLGGFHYEPWDTKLARSAKPYFLVQLSAYAEMLEAVQGVIPGEMVFVLGHGEERRFSTGDYYDYYLELKRCFLDFQARWDPRAMPHPGLDRSWGRWTEAAEQILERSDHLSRVANISRSQIKRLEARGVTTMSALAAAPALRVPKVSETVLERLRLQARLQVASATLDRPTFEPRPQDPAEPRRGLALLPPPSPLDVFFDLEGFPFAEGGLEYLWGATTLEQDTAVFNDWWAHDHAGEKLAFERFIDWACERRRRDPGMHIYHYAGYEKSAICRLMGRYASRENEVDDLLRGGVLVDLYTVVRQGLVVGTPSYSLKEIERVFGQKREGDVTTAAGSVVEYQRWLDSGEPGEWVASPILSAIRDYNRVDCESTWRLRDWLLAQQTALGIQYIPPPSADPSEEPEEPAVAHPVAELAERLKKRAETEAATDPALARVTELLAHLLEFHRREEKPMWWRMFDRTLCSEEQLVDDIDCLAGLHRTERPAFAIKKSVGLEYRFDPDQDTKLRIGSKVMGSHDLDWKATIEELDTESGLVVVKTTKPDGARDPLHLIPDEHVSAKAIKEAIQRFVTGWADGPSPSSALDDFLFRRLPKVKDHAGGPLLMEGDLVPQAVDIARRLEGTTLCIQGPPGTGKTYTAAAIIAQLLRDGKLVGVTSNSHKAIINLMNAVVEAQGAEAGRFPLIKVGSVADAEGAKAPIVAMESKAAAAACGNAPGVSGGTAWFFSRPELVGCFDYLFVDEAGQVSLANLVAIGSSAKNLILVGDQMQLSQPIKGSHPGESGLSCLDYLLQKHATIPPELGIFLGQSRRMHPDICRFISEAVYQGRLSSIPATGLQRIAGGSAALIPRETGVVFLPVEHEGNGQSSDEEVEVIRKIVAELQTRMVVDQLGASHPLTQERDILLVSPFNMQVRRLRDALGPSARIGSVDKFQGQEAPVVIVSLASSSLEDSPRGAEFLLNKNRLNVAVSRAQALTIVVASPALLAPRCRTIEEMALVNLLGKLKHHSLAGG